MRLPKWVVKWIKDNFDLEKAELKLKQQEEKIKKLETDVYRYRFNCLPRTEKEWIHDAYVILAWEDFWGKKYKAFIVEYMKERDRREKEWTDRQFDLPFN